MKLTTCAAILSLLSCLPVTANENLPNQKIEVGVGLVCNSEQQVQRYLSLHTRNAEPETAIRLVNTEAQDPNACSLAAIAFVRGKYGPVVPAPGGQMKVVEITIIAAQTPAGWQRVDHLKQFTAVFEKL